MRILTVFFNSAGKTIKLRGVLAVTFLIGFLIILVMGYVSAGASQITLDAYVTGNKISISSQVAGKVVNINRNRTDFVRKGEVLLRLDNSEATTRYAKAENKLTESVMKIKKHYMSDAKNNADIQAAQMAYQQALREYHRRIQFKGVTPVSKQDLEQAMNNVNASKRALDESILRYRRHLALRQKAEISQQLRVSQFTREVDQAGQALSDTEVRSPVSGYIMQRHVQPGIKVSPGQELMSVVPADQMWVMANFRTTETPAMLIGQKVSVVTDLYGKHVVFDGQIEDINPDSSAGQTTLSGMMACRDWMSDLQKISVRITLDPVQMSRYPLRMGIPTKVKIHDSNLSRMAKLISRETAPVHLPQTCGMAGESLPAGQANMPPLSWT
nr:efflux RND transporter periplasmic adaptor subunit [Serratia fonticola]